MRVFNIVDIIKDDCINNEDDFYQDMKSCTDKMKNNSNNSKKNK